ncbi:MAG: RNA polymerase sigma factor [Planctomycetes bacterium]|nr:RNA polymerase sigma factor [Planctomycetota bacterium]
MEAARADLQFETLFPEVAPALYAWASLRVRASLRSRLDPEDLLQEIGFRAWRGFSGFDPSIATFRSWVFGIAHRVLQEALRSVSRGAAVSNPSELLRDFPASATTVSRRVARDEAIRSFLARIEQLNEEDRRLVLWRGIEGLSHAQVAELLAVTADAAAKRWQRLREELACDETARAVLVG